jgi:hypothetical protein
MALDELYYFALYAVFKERYESPAAEEFAPSSFASSNSS